MGCESCRVRPECTHADLSLRGKEPAICPHNPDRRTPTEALSNRRETLEDLVGQARRAVAAQSSE